MDSFTGDCSIPYVYYTPDLFNKENSEVIIELKIYEV